MKFFQVFDHMKNGGFVTRKGMDDGVLIGIVGAYNEKHLPVSSKSELTEDSYFAIFVDNAWEPYCPYVQDLEKDDWIVLEQDETS